LRLLSSHFWKAIEAEKHPQAMHDSPCGENFGCKIDNDKSGKLLGGILTLIGFFRNKFENSLAVKNLYKSSETDSIFSLF
jgi:hypothetical protein